MPIPESQLETWSHQGAVSTAKATADSVKHARYYWLLLAEGHLPRRLFAAMLRRIEALPAPAG